MFELADLEVHYPSYSFLSLPPHFDPNPSIDSFNLFIASLGGIIFKQGISVSPNLLIFLQLLNNLQFFKNNAIEELYLPYILSFDQLFTHYMPPQCLYFYLDFELLLINLVNNCTHFISNILII